MFTLKVVIFLNLAFALCAAAADLLGSPELRGRDSCQDGVVYKNPSCTPQLRARDLLSRMTWEEKVGQMGGVRRLLGANYTFNRTFYDTYSPLQNGILGFGEPSNTAQGVLPIANRIRQEQINSTRLGIPWIVVTDTINTIYLKGGTIFPATLAMGATFNVPLYRQAVAAIRDENMASGVHWVLSPCLDLAREPRGGRVGEMYGEDKYHVGEFATEYVKTMQEKDADGFVKVATTIKHFVYGQNQGGINMASMFGGLNYLMNTLIPPYRKAIAEGSPLSIMASYAAIDHIPMAGNKYMLQDILRDALGFKGVIMSDAVAVLWLYTGHKVAKSFTDAAVMAVSAGLELELSPSQPAMFPYLANVNDTALTSLVDQAVTHLLEVKFATGTFDKPLPTAEELNSTLRSPAHLALARNISQEAIVMLRNAGNVLPLSNSSRKVALIGPFADIMDAGSYASSVNPADPTYGNTLLHSMRAEFGADNVSYVKGVEIKTTDDSTGIPAAVAAAKAAGLVVLCVGSLSTSQSYPISSQSTDGEAYSHADLGLPGLQQQLADAVLAAGVPTVVVVSGGQAFALGDSVLRRDDVALLHTFLGGEATADALVDVMVGRVNPSGKLPGSLPQASGATPAYYDYLPGDAMGAWTFDAAWSYPALPRAVPMPFGFGLSYTTFEFSAPKATYCARNGTVTAHVSATIANTGSRAGKEVVQVYFRQDYTAIETPVKQLIRFSKIELQPGEQKTVSFAIPHSELGYFVGTNWTVDAANFTFMMGSSSRDQDLKNVTIPLGVYVDRSEGLSIHSRVVSLQFYGGNDCRD